ncbi:MAG: GNAT family N-acetyltransferase [Candidatus Delongbacteria bacterium]|nr:GNAT family N-acetyltransferase [Candidatus Delongbacteria bacterium]MBN2834106.1 GNAT family N-acetyltransferase [Candidatus Delongbacteria bacterium]
MYNTLTVDKYSDLTEEQWDTYFNFRLLLDEQINSQTAYKSLVELQNKMAFTFNDTNRLIIIRDDHKFIAIIWLTRKKKVDFENARLDLTFGSLLYDIPLDIVDLIKKSILEFKQDNEPVYFQTSSFKYVELVKSLSGKLFNDALSFKLNLEDIDWENINQWYQTGKSNKDISLRLFKGLPKNKKLAQELLALWEMVDRDIPNSENYYDFFSNRGYIDESLSYAKENGGIDYFYTLFAKKDHKMIGLTHVSFYPQKSGYAGQSISGVIPEFRNHGLGKYLKAVMLKRLIKDFPKELKGVRTGVSKNNHAILKITKQMGFRFQGNRLSYKLDI